MDLYRALHPMGKAGGERRDASWKFKGGGKYGINQ